MIAAAMPLNRQNYALAINLFWFTFVATAVPILRYRWRELSLVLGGVGGQFCLVTAY